MNRDEAKAKAKQAEQYLEDQARKAANAAESKWPIGTMVTMLVIGMVLGAYLWSLWPHK